VAYFGGWTGWTSKIASYFEVNSRVPGFLLIAISRIYICINVNSRVLARVVHP
jgi:hypothetical protein